MPDRPFTTVNTLDLQQSQECQQGSLTKIEGCSSSTSPRGNVPVHWTGLEPGTDS